MAMKERVMAPPTDWIPMMFPVDIVIQAANATLGLVAGDQGRGQVAINDRPFLLRQITHQIIWHEVPIPPLEWAMQNGLYRIDWSEYEQVRFFKGAIPMADIAFGSIRDGNWIPLPAPVTLPGNQTLHVTVINEINFADPDIQKYEVEIIFHGIQKRGSISQTTAPGPGEI